MDRKKVMILLGVLFLLALNGLFIYSYYESIFNGYVTGTQEAVESEEIEESIFSDQKKIEELDGEELDLQIMNVRVSQQAIEDFPRYQTFDIPLVIIGDKTEKFETIILPNNNVDIKAFVRSQFSRQTDYVKMLYQKTEYIDKNDIYSEYRFRAVYETITGNTTWAEAYRIIIPLYARKITDGYYSYTGDDDEKSILATCDLVASDTHLPIIYHELSKTDKGYEYKCYYYHDGQSLLSMSYKTELSMFVDVENGVIEFTSVDEQDN